MDAAEVAAFLRGRKWGLLATVGGGMPYAVPVGYAYDGAAVYFASGAGKKRRNLEETGVACLTVPDVTDGTHWRCVVAAGRVTRLSGPLARVRALDLIRRKRGGTLPAAPPPGEAARGGGVPAGRDGVERAGGGVRVSGGGRGVRETLEASYGIGLE
jgi:nitroimidazol reductase NimA-like FMN-containing flavoprotein (pyridoxamine 5'-phosphate oxidase superfamily)